MDFAQSPAPGPVVIVRGIAEFSHFAHLDTFGAHQHGRKRGEGQDVSHCVSRFALGNCISPLTINVYR